MREWSYNLRMAHYLSQLYLLSSTPWLYCPYQSIYDYDPPLWPPKQHSIAFSAPHELPSPLQYSSHLPEIVRITLFSEYNLYDSQKEVFFQSLRILILLNLAVALWHQSMMMSDSELPMAQHYITALYFVVGFFSLNAHQLDSSDALTPQDQLIYTLF